MRSIKEVVEQATTTYLDIGSWVTRSELEAWLLTEERSQDAINRLEDVRQVCVNWQDDDIVPSQFLAELREALMRESQKEGE